LRATFICACILLAVNLPARADSALKTEMSGPKPLQQDSFGRLDLGDGASLNLEADRKSPEKTTRAEGLEPGATWLKPNRRLDPQFFGLSIKKPLD
jgi:hypothetical protein